MLADCWVSVAIWLGIQWSAIASAISVEDMGVDRGGFDIFDDPTVLGWCSCHSRFRAGEWLNCGGRCGNPLVFECLWHMTSRIWSNNLGWEDLRIRLPTIFVTNATLPSL